MVFTIILDILFNDSFIDRVDVSLNAVGRAPKLKVSKFKLKKSHTFQHLITFVRSTLEKGGAL
jgi:hypothetical protein